MSNMSNTSNTNHAKSNSLLILLATSFALGACAPAPDAATETDEGELHARPTGRDSLGGTVIVHGPASAAPLVAPRVEARTGVDDPLESVLGPFHVGARNVFVTTKGPDTRAYVALSVQIAGGKALELSLAGAQIRSAGAPATLGYPGATPITSTYVEGSAGALVVTAASISTSNRADGSTTTVVAPGTHLFTWGIGDGIRVDAKAGATTTLDLWDYSQRRVARVIAPESRDLPDACAGKASLQPRIPAATATPIDLKAGTSFEIGQHPDAAKLLYPAGDPRIIDIRLPCASDSWAVELGALGAGPRDFRIARLDVDHVDVTMDDGTVRQVHGMYQVYFGLDAHNRGRAALDSKYGTGTGVDLVPGPYTLVVEYPTSAGTTAYSTQSFTLP